MTGQMAPWHNQEIKQVKNNNAHMKDQKSTLFK